MKKRLLTAFVIFALIINQLCIVAFAQNGIIISDNLTDLSQVYTLRGFNCSNSAWSNCTSASRRVFYRSSDNDAYVIYDALGAESAEFDITLSNSDRWKVTDRGEIDNIIYFSSDGQNYVDASVVDGYSSEYEYVSTQNNHYTYILRYNFPAQYKYIKFDAGKFSTWQMYITGARTYGIKNEEVDDNQPTGYVSVGDGYVQALSCTVDNEGFDCNRYIGSKTGCQYVRSTAVKTSSGDAQLTYKAKNNDFCYIQAQLTVENFNNAWKLTDYNSAENNIYASADGISYIGVSGIKAKFTGESYDGAVGYSSYEIYGALPENTRYVKIDAGEFEAWNFMISEILLYSQYGENEFNYSKSKSLAKEHSGYFNVSVAVEPPELYDYNDILLSQFNEITIENQMKPNVMHPGENSYYFEGADRIVEFAQEHGLRVRGHGLVYEKTMPPWFFVDENGNRASKELVMKRLEEHVRTIVRRYKGRIYCYDVVNENFGHNGWDTGTLSEICGVDEYTRKVFEWAHEEDPDAILILNDNFYDIKNKANLIFNYVKELVDDGVPIHGIGFQEHHYIDTDVSAVDEYLTLFETIPDFKLFITELDVRAYTVTDDEKLYPSFMNDELKDAVAKKYASFFDVYRRHAQRIETLGLWNISDAISWTDSGDKKQFATLFAQDRNPNPAYFAALDTDGDLPRWEGNAVPPVLRNNDYLINTETDILTVSGVYSGNVTVKLSRNYGDKAEITSRSEDVSGDYKISVKIEDASYDGSVSPDYILEVTEGETEKIDTFAYFTKSNRGKYYTVTDNFSDYGKVYRVANTMFKDGGIATTRIWNDGAYFREGEVVYRCPYGFEAESFSLNMHKYSGDYYTVYFSEDDESYIQAETEWVSNGYFKYKGTVKSIPQGTKYIKIKLGTAKYNYLSYVELHTVKSVIEDEFLLFDSTLESTDGIYESNGFSSVNWAYGRCGYNYKRNVFSNTDNNSYMIFDAGNENRYTAAEFLVTLHGYYTWPIEEDIHLVNRIMVSHNGVNWIKADGIAYTKDSNIYYDGSTPYRNYKLTVTPEKPVRYIKLAFAGTQAYTVFVHNAKLYGCSYFELLSQPIIKKRSGSWIVQTEYITEEAGEMAVLAVYSGDAMISCDIQNFTASDDIRNVNLMVDIPEDKNTYAKLYIWTPELIPIYKTDNIH